MCIASHVQCLRASAQVVCQSVGKVARVVAKPTSHMAKVALQHVLTRSSNGHRAPVQESNRGTSLSNRGQSLTSLPGGKAMEKAMGKAMEKVRKAASRD